MSSYKVLFPCVVRSADGRKATDYRKVGAIIDVDDQAAAALVASRHLEPVAAPKPVPEKPPAGKG